MMRLLSLGAGVQSTALALLTADRTLPTLDGAIFADTGWEPRAVYEHLDRLEREVLTPAGIPLYRVSKGSLRADAIDPQHRYASVPYFVLGPPTQVRKPLESHPCTCEWDSYDPDDAWDVTEPAPCSECRSTGVVVTKWGEPTSERSLGMGRRQCTSEYKLAPINRKVRELLGAKAPDFRRVPRGHVAEQWIGFSTDEIHRVSDKHSVSYSQKTYPLLDLGMSRKDCARYLSASGWGSTTKSACIGCPYHGNAQWRDLRDNRPEEWADAVAFDREIRKGGARGLPLDGEAFLHRSRVPLDQAPIDRVTRREWQDRQVDLMDLIAENGDPDGCSPYGCRSGVEVA